VNRGFAGLVVACAVSAAMSGCGDDPAAASPPPLRERGASIATLDDPFEPLPLVTDLDPKKVALGEKLFADPILSPDGKVACTTCHELDQGGVDHRPLSDLEGHAKALVNTPTIFNVSINFKLHWGGAYSSLEEQLKVPIESPRVLATTFPDIVARLRASPEYVARFAEIYPEGVTKDSFSNAMVEYEKSLVTPRSRFDRYLRGERGAMTETELAGYAIFKSHGCASCHQGIGVGGNLFQPLGAMRKYFGERKKDVTETDNGRFNVTKREEDRHVFRVPSLRNVAVTAPYLHDGSVATLEEMIVLMSEVQLGRSLDADRVAKVAAFLRTLTGEYKGEVLR
jgi:cytochrome c peroxidase